MEWAIAALIVVGVVTLGGLALAKRRSPDGEIDVDPLFLAGIPLTGAGAALIATTVPVAVGLIALGLALIVIGSIRSASKS